MQILKEKSRAKSQITFDEDFNVPDAKPDVGRLIQYKGRISMDDVHLADGKGILRGDLQVDILYVGEENGIISSITAKLPFEETLNLKDIVNGDKLCLKWEIEDLTIRLIHSRKLNIKALVTFYGAVDETEQVRLPVALDATDISVRKKTVRFLGLTVHKKDTLRVKDEYTIASNRPDISGLIWYTMDIRGLDLKPEENIVKARGELTVFVLYESEDTETPVQWLEYSLPFSGEVECPDCTEELIPDIEVSVMHQSLEVKPDADGEERILVSDVVLELDMKFFREEEYSLVTDVYTPLRECVPEGKNEVLEKLLVRNFSRCRITDRIQVKETQGKILQLCHSQGKVKIDKTRIVENGVQADGVIMLKILYIIGNDSMPFYSMEAMIPFSHVVEARGIRPGSSYRLKAELEQLSAAMADGNEIEIRASVGLNLLAVIREPVFIIDKVEEKPLDMKKIQAMPGILIYMVKPGDELWDIARKYHTSIEEICTLNGLKENQEPSPGTPLLVVKKVEGQIK